MEFTRQEYWSGYSFPSPDDLPNPGIEPRSPPLWVDSLPAEPQGKPCASALLTTPKPLTVWITINCKDAPQAGIKMAKRNIHNLKYADDTTIVTESEEELKSLLMNVKEESGKLA